MGELFHFNSSRYLGTQYSGLGLVGLSSRALVRWMLVASPGAPNFLVIADSEEHDNLSESWRALFLDQTKPPHSDHTQKKDGG